MVLPEGGAGRGGGGDRLQGDTPLCLLMAELDATLKNHSWLGVFSFSLKGHDDRLFSVLGKDNKTYVKIPTLLYLPQSVKNILHLSITKISRNFLTVLFCNFQL